MKRLIAFLLLLIMPTFVDADMVGYSGDKRRYVTEEEKLQFPYNTVVRIVDNGNPGTGTFVSEDVILTCRHVVDGTDKNGDIEYYTSDGKKHIGKVGPYENDDKDYHDVSWIIDEDSFSGPVLEISPEAKYSNNLMIIGYDSLKPLSDDELKIVKQVYTNWIKDNGRITSGNAYKAMGEVDTELQILYSCSSDKQTNCVHCSGEYCIFDDSKNMKVRTGCSVVNVDKMLYTDCPGAPGASGSAIIDKNSNQIIGVFCSVLRAQIGQEKRATSSGVRPDIYYRSLKSWIDGLKQ
ncbi:MAG: trypsin-like peptidase domain-containing protein [Alphaproteobacteria bacterium]|nr:trypsin-like peptidase domain-containing protein [Alphaproteobacteria bacterium]